ncbi:hypothetical protein HN827_04640 [archaeon]|jgi:hypothetical protein|nr:hypothetical protein [archaeon]
MESKSEYKSISAKVSREEFTRVETYCKNKGVTVSSFIKELLQKEIKLSVPHNVAGMNKIDYNKARDNFKWSVILDNQQEIPVLKNISPAYLENLFEKINVALELRKSAIKKNKKDSVPIPSNIMRGKK